MTMLAAFAALLARVSGQRELAIGTGVANRRAPGCEGLLGMIINNLVLRCDLAGEPTFRELQDRVRATCLEAYAHQDLPFDRVVEAVEPRRHGARNPLFQVAFSFHDAPLPELAFRGLATEVDEMVSNGSAKFDLNVVVVPQREQRSGTGSSASDDSIRMIWEHSTELFEEATIERLMAQYERLLEAIVSDPDLRLGELPLTSVAEGALALAWSGPRRSYPRDEPLHCLVEAQADRTPLAVAIVSGEERISYAELDSRANRLAGCLLELGVRSEVRVGILLERSVEAVVAMVAVLKAGGAYLPLDPEDPPERLARLLEDAEVRVLLTSEAWRARLPEGGPTLLCLATDGPAAPDAARPEREVGAEDLAYVMYTSGSTGEPKGVCVPHRAIVRLVAALEEVVALGPAETLLQLAAPAFDAATFEIWGALATGARLALFPGRTGTPREIGEAIRRHGVTTLWLTAPLLRRVVEERPEALAGVRQLLAGGDVLSAPHVRRALEAHPGLTVVNGYGPTEATTFTCCHPMRDARDVPDPVPIGRPLANTRVHVLDAARRPVGPGIVGELWIGGDALARGYLGAPEATAERFVPDPFTGAPGDRLYRSGDLARWRPDGTLDFLGRADRQVKVRGHRVEPAEIERALSRHPALLEAAVRAWPDGAGDRRLVAYVVAAPGTRFPSASQLRAFLEASLPRPMLPSAFVALEALPLDARGKIDRGALPPPDPAAEERRPPRAPRTATEAALADIWREVLGRGAFGVEDDFFELGGHSLLAMQVAARLEARLGICLSLRRLFEATTISELARILETEGSRPRESPAPIARQPRGAARERR
jgi:amino acid adenylation domain-containing protein